MIGAEFWVTKRPTMFPICVFVGILDLVKVVLVELADKAGKIRVLEEAGEDNFCKLGHVLYDEAIALGTPADNVCKRRVFEHAKEFSDKVRGTWHAVFGIAGEELRVVVIG